MERIDDELLEKIAKEWPHRAHAVKNAKSAPNDTMRARIERDIAFACSFGSVKGLTIPEVIKLVKVANGN